ncbi:MAG: InlB B-repeat-containing protein, partial [Spirochaetaceae bacterium]|nr:InlB B-repeat-containing protein [Spirochaetaceae bacterium]
TAVTAAVGTSVTLAAGTGLTKSGYYFAGWNTAVDGGGTTYAAGASYTLNATVTLYAKWDAGFALIYDVNGGTGTPPAAAGSQTATSVTIAAGMGLNKADTSMDGYTRYVPFVGWNTKADGSGTTYAAGDTYALSANVTLYAQYGGYADLMVTFNVKTIGYALSEITTQNVTDTFNRVSTHIKTQSPSSVNPSDGLGLIKLGDYVELRSLNVAEYNGNGGGINLNTNWNNGTLQLMVVAINPYYNKNGNGTSTPHLIFHFKNYGGKARMEATDTNQNGYAGSEMRTYLVNNFWPALKNAGVPDGVVWPVSRRLANKGGRVATGEDIIEDKLWLPGIKEIIGNDSNSGANNNYETGTNQGVFGYYNSKEKRRKPGAIWEGNWWTASPSDADGAEAKRFVSMYLRILPVNDGRGTLLYTDQNPSKDATTKLGVVPAFAVK